MCNSCASLVLCFIACFILLVLAPLPTSFGGGEDENIGRRALKLGVHHGYTSADVGERTEVIEATMMIR